MAVSHHRISSLELFRRRCWCCRAFERPALADTESAGPVPRRLDLTGCVFHRDRSSNARQSAARALLFPVPGIAETTTLIARLGLLSADRRW